jgi:hypothetical protein
LAHVASDIQRLPEHRPKVFNQYARRNMRIIYNRSGGLMGLKSSLDVDLADLPLDQAETLRRLLDEAHFFTLTKNPPTPPHPDGFQYTITVETETATRTIHTSEQPAR